MRSSWFLLEVLAYAVLAAEPVPASAYRRWAGGRRKAPEPLDERALVVRSDLPPNVHRLFETWMACYRRANRAVGLYWLVPFAYLVLAPVLGWGDVARNMIAKAVAHCPVRPGPPVVGICAGLPPGCGVQTYHWPRGTWLPLHGAVAYILGYQCQRLDEVVGSVRREHSSATEPDDCDVSPAFEDLFWLVIGGVPVATASVGCNVAVNAGHRWYIGTICAHTRTGGGAMLLQHLQSEVAALGGAVRGLSLTAFTDANVDLYRRRGFRIDVPGTREMVWDAAPVHI